MVAMYVQASGVGVVQMVLVTAVVALLVASTHMQSSVSRRGTWAFGVALLVALVTGIASAFPSAYCDWFFKALGYCR
jgi:multisubunit Na+/H+ antiporter MnhB subunit